MTREEGRKPRELRKASYEIFADAATKLKIGTSELCHELGYSDSAHSSWKKEGHIPAPAALGCEALLRRNGAHKERTLIVKVGSTASADALKALAIALNAKVVEV